MHLRPATPGDLALVLHWDAQPHLTDPDVMGDPETNDWDWENQLGRDAPWREMLIAVDAGRPIGFIQIMDPDRDPDRYWGDRGPGLRAIDIWIGEQADIGRGYGRRMMARALARCFADPSVTAILIDPVATNTRAHRFYEAMGFRFVERRSFGLDDCFIYRLTRAEWRQGA